MTDSYEQYEKKVLQHLEKREVTGDTDFQVPPIYRDSPAIRKQLARVYNSIALTDKQIGKLLDRLKADNLMDSTIIVFYGRSEEHTSELQSLMRISYAVFCLKQKNNSNKK